MKGKFLLEQYAGFAAGFLLLHQQAQTQVVYTDIEPDLVFQDDGDFQYIDMNDDGIYEFGFLKSTNIISTLSSPGLNTTWYYRVAIWVGPAVVGPQIAGESVHNSSAGGTYYFPYALNQGALINNDLEFQAGGFQLMASKTAEIYYGYSFTILGVGDWHLQPANWNNLLLDSIRYLGVRFEDQENCLHYGWIRCVVMDSVDKLIVKDFAYETQCNQPILTGDTISYVDIASTNSSPDFSIYTFEDNIYIHKISNDNFDVIIINIAGQAVFHETIIENTNAIDMRNQPKGVYLVTIKNNERSYSKKVVIE
ncbi:MAG TPA: T9SS type A sorting domain-containing protein [Chitinophagales bacterium]|nr:T9SS type A sorting domain-containing protein [Chitinophagales bacterium]HNF69337.1 T9SS type A sorting domain-containing protein [Chitinophagales bacterium]HNI54944.1 T9SS type A sorting domain-containing protein [Chitinophagales bacterium]HNJ90115.1 T9SS type A sorting domain-containing protein [Chitinophagales bacterium]